MRFGIMRKIDGACIDLIDAEISIEEADSRKRLGDWLPADRIAQLQHQGVGVDVDTEVYVAVT